MNFYEHLDNLLFHLGEASKAIENASNAISLAYGSTSKFQDTVDDIINPNVYH